MGNDVPRTAIHWAAASNSFVMVEYLLLHGDNVNLKDEYGQTALHWAAKKSMNDSHQRLVRMLLKKGADVNAWDEFENTPFHLLVKSREVNHGIFKLLLEAGTNVYAKDIGGFSALHFSAMHNDVTSVKCLLAHGADVNARSFEKRTPLHILMINSQNDCYLDLVKVLMESGIDVNAVDENGNSALGLLVEKKKQNVETLKFLLESGANANVISKKSYTQKTNEGRTALFDAIENNDFGVAKILMAGGADVNSKDENQQTPLHHAFFKSNQDDFLYTIKVLLENNADPNIRDCFGYTPLALGLKNITKNPESLKYLLKNGTDLNAKGIDGETILHQAVSIDNISLENINLLLEHNADINAQSDNGETPLHCLLINPKSNLQMFQLLLKSGADVKKIDNQKRTALHLAAMMNKYEYIQELLSKGAKIDEKGMHDWTALHYATFFSTNDCNLKVVEKLLGCGACVSAQDVNGNTPFHFLFMNSENNTKTAQLLCDKGIDVNVKNHEALTPLHHATLALNESMMIFLISRDVRICVRNSFNQTVLHSAASVSNGIRLFEIFKFLLNEKVEVNAKDMNGDTALHLVIKKLRDNNNQMIVELMLDNKADVNAKNNQGFTVLHLAAMNNDSELVEYLLSRGASVDAVDKFNRTPLLCAALKSDQTNSYTKVLEVLLEKNAAVNAKDVNGDTALHILTKSISPSVDVFKLLLEKGANGDIVNNTGSTVMHLAAIKNAPELIEHLLSHGMDVNKKHPINLVTPLHCAIFVSKNDSHLEVVKILLENRADVDAKDKNGNTPINLFIVDGKVTNYKILQLFLNYCANVNLVNYQGRAPLHLAAKYNATSMVESLLTYGADVDVVDANNWTPLHYAVLASKKDSHLRVVELLLENKAQVNLQDIDGDTPLHLLLNGETINFKIVKLLFNSKADVNIKNNQNISPLELTLNNDTINIIEYIKSQVTAYPTNQSESNLSDPEQSVSSNSYYDESSSESQVMSTNDLNDNSQLYAEDDTTNVIDSFKSQGIDLDVQNESHDTSNLDKSTNSQNDGHSSVSEVISKYLHPNVVTSLNKKNILSQATSKLKTWCKTVLKSFINDDAHEGQIRAQNSEIALKIVIFLIVIFYPVVMYVFFFTDSFSMSSSHHCM